MRDEHDPVLSMNEALPDALTRLRDVFGSDVETTTKLSQERLRVRLTDALRQARSELGLSQRDMAKRLGTSQARISHIESAGRDRRLDTVLGYTEALGVDLLLALRVGDRLIQVNRPQGTRITLLHELDLDTLDDGHTTFDLTSIEMTTPLGRTARETDEATVLEVAA